MHVKQGIPQVKDHKRIWFGTSLLFLYFCTQVYCKVMIAAKYSLDDFVCICLCTIIVMFNVADQ